MRMWKVNPEFMCNKHLLGEHVEMHMFIGTLKKGVSIKGYIDKGLIEPSYIYKRHEELVNEMKNRGMNHNSPIKENIFNLIPEECLDIKIDIKRSEKELFKRCKKCKKI